MIDSNQDMLGGVAEIHRRGEQKATGRRSQAPGAWMARGRVGRALQEHSGGLGVAALAGWQLWVRGLEMGGGIPGQGTQEEAG